MSSMEPSNIDCDARGRLATADDVLELLPISRGSLYCLVREGRLPGVVRIGRRVYFDLDQLDAWIKEGGEVKTV